MVVLNTVQEPPIVDVVLLIEDTALGGFGFSEIKNNYIVPTLEHFNGGPASSDLDFASLSCSSSFSVVPFHASDCLPLPPSSIIGPYTSVKRIISVLDKLPFKGGKGQALSSGQEAIANALQLFKEVERKRGEDVATARHIIYVCNSGIYDMPVMDNCHYQGRKLEDLTTEIQDKGIFLSVFAPRRMSALVKLFEKAGGDLVAAKDKNYAKDPRHLVLLNGFQLQERPVTPKPNSSVSPSNLQNIHDQVSQGQVGFGQNQGQNIGGAPQQQGNFVGQQQQQGVMVNQQQQQQGQGSGILFQSLNKEQEQQGGMPKATNLINILNMPPQAINNRPPVSSQPFMQQQQQQVSMSQQQPMQQQQQQPVMVQPGGPGPNVVRPGMQPQQPGMQQQPQQGGNREYIWRGELEWHEKVKDSDQKITHNVHCSVSTQRDANTGLPEVKSDNWPSKLIMQLIPKSLVQTIGGFYFRQSKSVLFHPQECDSLVALTNVMGTGFAGCVHFTGSCDIKVLILLYSNDKKAYLGFIPNDQISFVERIRTVIQQQKQGQHIAPGQQQPQQQQQQGPGGPGPSQQMRMPMSQGGNMMTSQAGQPMMGGGGGMMMGQGQRMMMSQGQQMMQQQQPQYVTMQAGGGPGGMQQQQRIMQGQAMTPGLRQILQQQQQPGMMNMMQQQQGGMQPGNNQVNVETGV